MTLWLKIRSLWSGALLLTASCLICLLLVEMLLRAGVIKNYAYHRAQYSYAESEGVEKSRILILGDSFIFAGGELSNSLLAELSENGFSVLNSAEPGMGPFQYSTEMEVYYRSFNPNVVLLSYYVGNDLTNVQFNLEFWTDTTFKTRVRNFLRPKLRRLYLYHFLNQFRLAMSTAEAEKELRKTKERHNNTDINPLRVMAAKAHPNYHLDSVLMETEDNMKAWQKIKELLLSIKEKAEQIDAKLLMVIFPASIQIDRTHFELFDESGFNVSEKTLESRKPQQLLLDFCKEQSIDCLDLLPVLKEESLKGKIIYPGNDDHLNSLGNSIAYDKIRSFLISNAED